MQGDATMSRLVPPLLVIVLALNSVDSRPSYSSFLKFRGGSTATSATGASATRDYRLQQHLYLQSRSIQLRQALISRGLDEFGFTKKDTTSVKRKTDWDCALASDAHPKSCLYSFDAQPGQKVLAPLGTTQWISAQALNRLRRTDPTKVEPLWHTQYAILSTWFAPDSEYSVYRESGARGAALSSLLDVPLVLAASMAACLTAAVLVFWPVLEALVSTLLTAPALWAAWPRWGRFVHAALPLKLLLAQMAYKGVSAVLKQVYHKIRNQLVEYECQLLQDCLPLTILEDEEEQQGDYDDDDNENDSYNDSVLDSTLDGDGESYVESSDDEDEYFDCNEE